METITNAATAVLPTAVTSTVSSLVYGKPKEGEEPVSGTQGKGTANEPFDQGNAENPVAASSAADTAKPTGNTSATDDDFLKLNPVVNRVSDSSPASGATSGATGVTDKAGVSEQVWKPTDIDEVKPSGAPGAGPSAPEYTPATPDLSSKAAGSTPKPAETTSEEKKTEGVETAHSDSAKAQPSVGGPIQEVLDKGPGASKEHTIDESEVEDPSSKMNDKTHRATDAHKTGESGDVETHAAETTKSHSTDSGSKAAESSSPSNNEEKSEKKMDKLKDKLKTKLHIGSKDK